MVILCLLFAAVGHVLAQGPTAPPATLTDAQGEYPLAADLEILRDPTRQLTIRDVTSPAFADKFTLNQEPIPNLGITTDAVWVRFRVRNRADAPIRWLLALHEQRTGKVDLYLPEPDGSFEVKQTGRDLPFATRDVPNREYVFNLDLPAAAEETIYLRLQSNSPQIIPLTVWSSQAFLQREQTDILLYGLFYGAMLIMAGYNLFLFFSLRERTYLYLALFILFYSLNQGARDGLAPQYLYPTLSNRYINEISAVLMTIFLILFSTNLLETRARAPRLHRLLVGIILVFPVWFLVHVFFPLNAVGLVLIQAAFVLLGIAGYKVWRQGYRPALLYLVSWALFFVVAFLYNLNAFGLFPGSFFTDKPLLVASALGALLGSLALAERVSLLKAQAEASNRSLERSERKYRSLFDSALDGIFVSTRAGKLVDLNPTMLDLFGVVRSDLPRLNPRDFYADPADRDEMLRLVAERGYVENYPVRLRRSDGSELDALISATPWQDENTGEVGFQGVIRDVTAQRRIERELAQQQAQLQQAVADERGRLARELHDSVTQSLYSIGLYDNAAARALRAGKREVGADHVNQIIQLALEAMVDMRSLIFELRPPELEKVGLAAALQARLQAVEGRAGIHVDFHTTGEDKLPLPVATELYRIGQEALTNVVKHANAKHVTLDLNFESECTSLEIRDDGKGLDLAAAQQKNTMGLRSITERAQKIRGVLTVSGEPGKGTTVRVEVPND